MLEPAPPVALEKTPPEAVNFTSLHPGVGLSYLDLWTEAEKVSCEANLPIGRKSSQANLDSNLSPIAIGRSQLLIADPMTKHLIFIR